MRIGVDWSLAIIVAAVYASAPATAQGYDQYAKWCDENGGVAHPSPARCEFSSVPVGPPPPTLEELRRQREAKDLQDAANDAQDYGDLAMTRKNYDEAIKRFEEALTYAPDDSNLQNSLAFAKRRKRERDDENARQTAVLLAQSQPQPRPPPSPKPVDLAAGALKNPPQVKTPISDPAYAKGLEDGRNCMPQNAGGYCAAETGARAQSCADNYHGGYNVGQSSAQTLLRGAFEQGRALKAQGKPFEPLGHPVQSQCGIRQTEAFVAGYSGAAFSPVGR
jgi:tetratricopeptide (TPR) repeat protein